ncbi:ATPase [Nostoc minutum NIES-26]|uniref:ATPase n=1 Tax=Nostoc minutum NIES-26 TaxID=1844469 RepID=A0A367Q0Y0_9NOSO|nr:ATPase [Nostoc minutum NIES-26]
MRLFLEHFIEQQTNQPLPVLLDQLASNTVLTSAPPALDRLCAIFNLSAFERNILLLCVGMELDKSFEKLCADASGNSKYTYPTLGMALTALPGAHLSVLSQESPLQHWQLIEINSGSALTKSPLRIDQRILCYLVGEPYVDKTLESFVKPISVVEQANIKLQPSHQNLAEQLVEVWSSARNTSTTSIIQLCDADLTASSSIASLACIQVSCNLCVMKAHRLPADPDKLNQLIQRWEREAFLSNSALLLDCHQVNTQEQAKLSAIAQLVENINTHLIITSRERLPLSHHSFITFDVPKLTTTEQLAIWQDTLGDSCIELNGHVEALVAQFNLSQGGIQAAVATAKGKVNTQETEPTQNHLALALWDSCRIQARPQLDDLATRIDITATWDDLVLPEQQQQTLREMITHVRQRMTVYEKWGFATKSCRGLGIAALFTGTSGTGKTMSAEVIANELRLDLYRIDLSAVVSKYIGETEKNLRRIFDAAEAGGAVLLFDEADALFSKRTQVKDSHDRNANMETNYLLQRMEAYQGLAILTTNLKDSIDTAFLRRIRFVIEYPFPNARERKEIWRRIFPINTPTQGLDYAKLARLNVSGGIIRNIALNAAFLAAEASESVTMKHLLNATINESRKSGQGLTDAIKDWV